MAKPWNEVTLLPQYHALSDEEKENARNEYFADVIAPNTPTEELKAARAQFDDETKRENVLAENMKPRAREDGITVGGMRAEEPSFIESIINPLRSGYYRGKQGVSLALSEMGLKDRDVAKQGVRLADLNRQSERHGASVEDMDALQRVAEADSIGGAVSEMAENPQVISNTVLESLGLMAPGLAVTAGASILGGPLATALGAGTTSGTTEYVQTISQVLQESGVDPSDPRAWAEALSDPDLMSRARESGVKRGVPIGAFDALTAGLAGKLLQGAKGGFVSPASRATGEAGMQAGGGMAGEAGAQYVDEGEITSPGEIALEGVAEGPTAAVEVPGNIAHARAAARARENQPDAVPERGPLSRAANTAIKQGVNVATVPDSEGATILDAGATGLADEGVDTKGPEVELPTFSKPESSESQETEPQGADRLAQLKADLNYRYDEMDPDQQAEADQLLKQIDELERRAAGQSEIPEDVASDPVTIQPKQTKQKVVRKNGEPFATEQAAKRAMRPNGVAKTHKPVQVDGGYALVPIEQETETDEAQVPTAQAGGQDSEVTGRESLPDGGQSTPIDQNQATADPMQEPGVENQSVQTAEEKQSKPKPHPVDPRLKRPLYRDHLKSAVSRDMEPNSGGNLIPKEGATPRANTGDLLYDYGSEQLVRTPSNNPDWVQSLLSSEGVSVKYVRQAAEKALKGERLGKQQQRVVQAVLDEIGHQRDVADGDAIRQKRLDALNLRRMAKAAKPISGSEFDDIARPEDYDEDGVPGEQFEESAYDPDWDGEALSLSDLANDATEYDEAGVEALMQRGMTDGEVAVALWNIIEKGKENAGQSNWTGSELGKSAEEDAGKQKEGDHPSQKAGDRSGVRSQETADTETKAEVDLIGDDTRVAQAVADKEIEKDDKRSPSGDQPALVQDGDELFANNGQLEPDLFDGKSIDTSANEAATSPTNDLPEPTQAQKEAGNYKVGKISLHGLDVSIENPKGSTRSGVSPEGKQWSSTMKSHYGYFKGTVGKDKDHVDVFLGPDAEQENPGIFVVDQIDPETGKLDEHKVMFGYPDEASARAGYLENYDKGWKGLGAITSMPLDDFKGWVKDPAKTKQWAGVKSKSADRTGTITRANGKPFANFDVAKRALKNQGKADTYEPVEVDGGFVGQPIAESKAPSLEEKEVAELEGAIDEAEQKGRDAERKEQEAIAKKAASNRLQADSNKIESVSNPSPMDSGAVQYTVTVHGVPSEMIRKPDGNWYGGEHWRSWDIPHDKLNAALGKRAAGTLTSQPNKEKKAETSEPKRPAGYGKSNKVFTEDAAAKAREILRKKLGQLNSGLDPEMMQAGITLAGYHIESGARKFADFTRVMIEDLGEGAREYLRSWYEGVRHWPGMGDAAADMTPISEMDAAELAALKEAQKSQPSTQQEQSDDPHGGYHYDEVVKAHRHTSRDPIAAAQLRQKWFEEAVMEIRESLQPKAETDKQKQILEDEIERFKTEYMRREKAALSARESTVSPHIAGRSKFNSKQAGRRSSALDSAEARFAKWLGREPGNIEQALLDGRNEEQKRADTERAVDERQKRERDQKATEQRIADEKAKRSAEKRAKPIINEPSENALEITKTEWKKTHKDYKGTQEADTYRYRSIIHNGALTPVFITDQKVVNKPSNEPGAAEVDAESAKTQEQQTIHDRHAAFADRLREGNVSLEEYQKAFEDLAAARDDVLAELSKETKATLLDRMGGVRGHRYKSEKKNRVVQAAYTDMLDDFMPPTSDGGMYSYTPKIGGDYIQNHIDAVRTKVESVTQDKLDAYAKRVSDAKEELKKAREEALAGMEDPQTQDDYARIIRANMEDGMTYAEARMTLTPEQRAEFDQLVADKSRKDRNYKKDQARTAVASTGVTTGAEIVETKHTRDGYDLFVVQPAERVERDVYKQWLASAKKLGGWYSAYRARGAVPGFQFKTRESAEAFQQYISDGDTDAVKAQAQARRDAFSDDRSQSAVERLREMAARLDDKANASLSQDRKTNTVRRAGMAARAEAAAEGDKATAETMRRIADAIESGDAQFLDSVRTKAQVEMLESMVRIAKNNQLREKYPTWTEQEKHRGEKATSETADYSEWPTFTAYRSDWARLGRQALETDGMKQIGQKILKTADDVTDAYIKFAKDNMNKVATFSREGGEMAAFKSKKDAQLAISRSGFRGQAIPLQVKRGENLIILSPAEAQKRGIWSGDNDKRITMRPDFVEQLIGKSRRKGLDIPWQFESAHAKRTRLSSMGIETPAEFRAALREFIGLQETAKEPDKIKQMEREMIGRRKDGLDFFPTPHAVADEMVETANIEEGMSVLEPSAGMGHIAERVRETGVEPDVVEFSGDRRELLEAKGFNVVGSDFLDVDGEYDRIIMNPPFSDRRDAEHVRHAYSLLKPGGRLVSIMGEGVFFGSDKRAQGFREWLESVEGTEEKLAEGTFQDASLPVSTGVNARMVVIDKAANDGAALLSLGGRVNLRPVTLATARAVVGRVVAANKKRWNVGIDLYPTFDSLPDEVKQAVAKYGEKTKSKGVLHNGTVHVVADLHESEADVEKTILHEVEGHVGIRRLYGKDITRELNKLYAAIGGRKGLTKIGKERGTFDSLTDYAKMLGQSEFTDKMRVQIMMEEALAHLAESPKFGDRVKAIVGKIRQWLRDRGLAKLAEYGETDLLHILAQGRKELRKVKTDDGEAVLMVAYHGTPHTFDRFSLDAIGTGEGAQAYGWGLYFAGSRDVAKWYKDKLSNSDLKYDGKGVFEKGLTREQSHAISNVASHLTNNDSIKGAVNDAKEVLNNQIKDADSYGLESPYFTNANGRVMIRDVLNELNSMDISKFSIDYGNIYQVDIPEDHELLDWDKPLSEQPEGVREKVISGLPEVDRGEAETLTGKDVHDHLRFGKKLSPRAASEYLNSLGIPGSRYLDGSSRSAGEGNYNYVIWDESVVTVEAVNDELRQAEERQPESQTAYSRSKTKRDKPSRPEYAVLGMPIEEIEATINPIIRSWVEGPKVVVVSSMADPAVPEAAREDSQEQRSRGASGEIKGFYRDGVAYLVAQHIVSPDAAVRVLFHEVLGHAGLRVFGKQLNKVLDQITSARRPIVVAKARHYGYATTLEEARQVERVKAVEAKKPLTDAQVEVAAKARVKRNLRAAAEEVLAEMAETRPKIGFVRRAVAAIREWLRKHVPALRGLKLSDDEIIRDYLIPARDYIEKGRYTENHETGNENNQRKADHSVRWEDRRGTATGAPGVQGSVTRGVQGESPEGDAGRGRGTGSRREPWLKPGFVEWFDDSKVVDSNGDPRVFYRGESDPNYFVFDKAKQGSNTRSAGSGYGHFFGPSRRIAEGYGTVREFYLSIQNPFVMPDEDFREVRTIDEARAVADWIASQGYDGIYLPEDDTYIAFEADQIKLTSNETFTKGEPDIRYSRSDKPADPVLESARRKAGLGERPTFQKRIRTHIAGLFDLIKNQRDQLIDAFRQGTLDQFHGIKRAEQRTMGNLPAEQSPYVAARLSTGIASVMRGILLHGQPQWAENGQNLEKKDGTKGLLEILEPVSDRLDDFIGWMVGNRAARLLREGRENNFTEEEVAALIDLGAGNKELFGQVAREFAAFKRSILDVGEEAGLIDPQARQVWDHADWIPFYRQREEAGETLGPRGSRGLAGKRSGIRQLKGGDSALNDPLENIIMNFHSLLDASLKNNAVNKAIAYAGDVVEPVGLKMTQELVPNSEVKRSLLEQGVPEDIVDMFPASVFKGIAKMWSFQAPNEPDVIRVMRDGKPKYFRVRDPLLLKAVTSFQPFDFPGLGAARAFKRVLTSAVTATPEFMLRNFIRDTASTAIISRDMVAASGAFKGIIKAYNESGAAEHMLFAGASFASGYIDGSDTAATARAVRRSLRKKGLDASAVDNFMGTVIDSTASMWEKYRHVSESIENANREAVFEATEKDKGNVTAAAFEAKDLMDFSLRGSWTSYQLLADVIPFFNARIQGMYRLGRTSPAQLAIRGSMLLTLPTMMLALSNLDNDDYEDLKDWDKDTYWHFWIGGHHQRIPKPFEVGVAFATIPERAMNWMFGEDDAKKFGKRLGWNLTEQMNLVEWPQIAKPLIEVVNNYDSFSERDIETMSDKNRLPHLRYNSYTSDTMRELVGAMGPAADMIHLSPKKAQHLVEGYLGTFGAWGLAAIDSGTRIAVDAPPEASWRADDFPVMRVLYRGDGLPARTTQHIQDVYDGAREYAQIKGSYRGLAKEGAIDEARALLEKHRDRLTFTAPMDGAAKALSKINRALDAIAYDKDMSPEEKRKEIDRLLAQRNRVARNAVKKSKELKRASGK